MPLPPCAARSTVGLVLSAAVIASGLTGCSGESETNAKPTITDPTELVGAATINYRAREPYEPQFLTTTQGQFLFVAVVSDTAGHLDLEGDESIKQAIKPGKVSTVVVNAAETGMFELNLRHGEQQTLLATVEVKQ